MRAILLGVAIALTGCSKPMTNAQIIETAKACEAAGMVPHIYVNLDAIITTIQCWPTTSGEKEQ